MLTYGNIDYEEKKSYTINVESKDKKLGCDIGESDDTPNTIQQRFIIHVKNIVEIGDPVLELILSNDTISENLPTGSFVATIINIRGDASYSYTLEPNYIDNNKFSIRNDSLFSNQMFDFESRKIYFIRVSAPDGVGGISAEEFNIHIIDRFIALSNQTIKESSPTGTTIGDVFIDDPSINPTFFDIRLSIDHPDNSNFLIKDGRLVSNFIFDYEIKNSYTVKIETAESKGDIYSQEYFTITIEDAVELNPSLIFSAKEIEENVEIGTSAGNFSVFNSKFNVTYSYILLNEDNVDNAKFEIVGDELRTKSFIDYEEKNSLSIKVGLNDNSEGLVSEYIYYVSVIDVNEEPSDIFLSNTFIKDDIELGDRVGIFTVEDEDRNDSHVYNFVELQSSNDNDLFDIRDDSILVTKSTFDKDIRSEYNIYVQVSDKSSSTYNKIFDLSIIDGNQGDPLLVLDKENSIDVYPNPFSDNLYLGLHSKENGIDIRIIALGGGENYEWNYSVSQEGLIQLDVSSIPSGTYILEIKSDRYRFHKTIIKP